jgi:probable rRNA maturation factor
MVPVRIPAGQVRSIISRVFKDHGKLPTAVNYIFCTDKFLLKINKKYLGHNFFTDIVTFDLSDNPREVSADIFISSDRVRQNATDLGVPIFREFVRVILHGALHLVGFRDKTKAERKAMREAEDKYLSFL